MWLVAELFVVAHPIGIRLLSEEIPSGSGAYQPMHARKNAQVALLYCSDSDIIMNRSGVLKIPRMTPPSFSGKLMVVSYGVCVGWQESPGGSPRYRTIRFQCAGELDFVNVRFPAEVQTLQSLSLSYKKASLLSWRIPRDSLSETRVFALVSSKGDPICTVKLSGVFVNDLLLCKLGSDVDAVLEFVYRDWAWFSAEIVRTETMGGTKHKCLIAEYTEDWAAVIRPRLLFPGAAVLPFELASLGFRVDYEFVLQINIGDGTFLVWKYPISGMK